MTTRKRRFLIPFASKRCQSKTGTTSVASPHSTPCNNPVDTSELPPQPALKYGTKYHQTARNEHGKTSSVTFFRAINLKEINNRDTDESSKCPSPVLSNSDRNSHVLSPCLDKPNANVYEFTVSPKCDRELKQNRYREKGQKELIKQNVLKTIFKMSMEIQDLKKRREELCTNYVATKKQKQPKQWIDVRISSADVAVNSRRLKVMPSTSKLEEQKGVGHGLRGGKLSSNYFFLEE